MAKEAIKSHQDLEVYKMAFKTAMDIFELTKSFPIEEKYSLYHSYNQIIGKLINMIHNSSSWIIKSHKENH